MIDLHWRLDQVRCTGCTRRTARASFRKRVLRLNPDHAGRKATDAPGGDADLVDAEFSSFVAPSCGSCGGVLKPDVVCFGESLPRERVEVARAVLARADAGKAVGSSLITYSGFRFVQAAVDAGEKVAAVNLGRTRADGVLALKVEGRCGGVLDEGGAAVVGDAGLAGV